ncbi:MAG: NirD/YgiW/YdeI family stress tolerance protein [Desulfovibrio sp.]|nr:NirD/YgiW/YdeI family stress tolerance protein [Desulfovibrio sp.]
MRFLLSFALILLLSAPVMAAKSAQQAGEQPAGRFEGPVRGAQTETVENALKLAPDSRVVLKGHIVASMAGKKNIYIFKDDTGEITVAITPKQFGDQIIKPETEVQLAGKIISESADGVRLRVSKLDPVQ